MTTLAWQLILQVVLILLNAVFACAEIAVISAKDAKIAAMAQEGNRRAIRLERLTNQPARFLATIQVAITLSGFLGSAFAADNFSEALVDWMVALGADISPRVLDSIAVVLITLILSYFTLIFGELVPKRLAMKNAEKLALAVSGLVTFISVVFKPIVSLLTASTNGMLRLLRVDPDSEEDVYSEEEIRMMAVAGSQQGTIGEQENAFIQNLFEFDDLTAEEFCTHRTQMSVLWADEGTEEWEREIFSSRHTARQNKPFGIVEGNVLQKGVGLDCYIVGSGYFMSVFHRNGCYVHACTAKNVNCSNRFNFFESVSEKYVSFVHSSIIF